GESEHPNERTCRMTTEANPLTKNGHADDLDVFARCVTRGKAHTPPARSWAIREPTPGTPRRGRIARDRGPRHNASRHTRLRTSLAAATDRAGSRHTSCWEPRRMDVATPHPPADTATEKAPMDALVIQGGRRLSGRVTISGAKNAALPVMA